MNEAQLRERIEVLEEENRQLREQLVPVITLPEAWGVTQLETRLLLTIRAASPHAVSLDRAMMALYGFEDGPGPRSVYTFICLIRRRLAAAGLPGIIENRFGRGWCMSPDGVRAFDAALSQREAA